MRLYKKPTKDGLWHPVQAGDVMWPVEVNIYAVTDDNGAKTGRKVISTYTFGTEERLALEDYPKATLWLQYSNPKLPKGAR